MAATANKGTSPAGRFSSRRRAGASASSSERGRSKRSTNAMFARLRRTHDPHLFEALVARFLPLAHKLARRYHRGGEPLEDLIQVANVGLVKAVKRFDERRGVSFSTYAVPTITGELKRYFRDNGWALHVPRGLRERALVVNRAIREALERTGRVPDTRSLAGRLDMDEREVLSAREAYEAFHAASLDAPASGIDVGEAPPRVEAVGDLDPAYELAEDRTTIGPALRQLPMTERRVLLLRFGQDLTQPEIARRIGVSQMQVSRILRRTIERLRLRVGRPPASG